MSDNCAEGEKTVTITLNPNMGGTFEDYLVIKTGGDEAVKRIPLTAIINKANQTIAWTDKSLTTADRQVSIATASSNLAMNYEIVSGSEFAIAENNTLDLPAISVINAGKFTIRAYHDGNESYNAVEDTKEFTSTIGTIVFDNNKTGGINILPLALPFETAISIRAPTPFWSSFANGSFSKIFAS